MKRSSEKNNEYYVHQVTYNRHERLVGLFVFSAFVLFLFFIFISVKNQHFFDKRVIFYIDVDSSEGISQGTLVKAMGTEVGKVSALRLTKDQKVRLIIEVYEGRRALLRVGARALVNRLTTIGSALIEIRLDSADAPVLPAESIIPVDETPSLNDLLLGIADVIQTVTSNNLVSKTEAMLPKIEQTLSDVHKIIEQIATGHGTLGAAVFDQQVEQELKVVVKSGAELLTEAEGIISTAKKRLEQLEPVLSDAKYMTHDLRGASENLPEMVTKLNEIVNQTKIAITLINKELNDLPGVGLDARRTLTKTEQLLESAQQTWPLSIQAKEEAPVHIIQPHPIHE